MREFTTGATRDSNDNKPEYNRYNSVRVARAFADYMIEHQVQADGKKRAGDNWKKGIPFPAYIDSYARHNIDVWELAEAYEKGDIFATIEDISGKEVDLVDSLCAALFNLNGLLDTVLQSREASKTPEKPFVRLPLNPLGFKLAKLAAPYYDSIDENDAFEDYGCTDKTCEYCYYNCGCERGPDGAFA